MPKFFTKKQFVAFLASFFITILCGFFIWDLFFSPNSNSNNYTFIFNKILGQASVSSPKVVPIVPQDALIELEASENLEPNPPPENKNFVATPEITREDLLDDIEEQLDDIKSQVLLLIEQQNAEKLAKIEPELEPEIELKPAENAIIYPKIVISEIGVAGDSDDKQEMVELYNPNNFEIDLTGWYLQRKTFSSVNWSTYASSNLFLGKKISANGYFLIARNGYYIGVADIFVDNPITADNSFVLKNPAGEVSDLVGFGNCSHFEGFCAQNPSSGQGIGRKVAPDGLEQDTENNLLDFDITRLTPRLPNQIFVAQSNFGSFVVSNISETAKKEFPKILISEIQLLPIAERFVELYNPNSFDVSLTDWYLQRKTENGAEYSSFVTKTNFADKTILANSYFLISRSSPLSDILFENMTVTKNNSFVLKNPDREIVDELNLKLFENPETEKSLCRENDILDFKICFPTPKSQNQIWTSPPTTDSGDYFL